MGDVGEITMNEDEVKRLADVLSRDLGQLQVEIGGMKSEMSYMRRDFDKVMTELDVADVRVQRVKLDSVTERLRSIEEVKSKVVWLVISSVILALLSVVFGAALRG